MTHALAALLLALATPPTEEGPRLGAFLLQVDGLDRPAAAAFTSTGELLVVETGAHRVLRLAPDGARRGSLGRPGDGPGELRLPRGIAVAPDGSVWVADTGNDRVQVFAPDGRPRATIGRRGGGPGELLRPAALVVDDARAWVCDTGNGRVQVFDHAGRFLTTLGRRGRAPGELARPAGVAVDADGHVHVADTGNHRVQTFGPSGELLAAVGHRGPHAGLFSEPAGLAWRAGELFVVDRENHRVQVLPTPASRAAASTADAGVAPRYEWGLHALRPGEGEGRLHYPDALALSPDGERAVVCESFSDRIQVFGPVTGDPAASAMPEALVGTGSGAHFGPALAAVGERLALIEPETQSVLVYDVSPANPTPTPLLVTRLGTWGEGAANLRDAVDVAFAPDGRTLAVSDGAGRVCEFELGPRSRGAPRFDPTLWRFRRSAELERLLATRAPELLAGGVEPGALAYGPDGILFVVDRRGDRVLALDRRFDPVASFGGRGTEPGELREPTDLAWSAVDATLWVVDAGNRRVQGFSAAGEPRRAWSGAGADGARLTLPHGVAVARDGSLVVTDAREHRVRRFDAAGRELASFGGPGLGAGELRKPRGVGVDGSGRVLVLDHGNHRGQLFALDGAFLHAFGPRAYVRPTGVRP